VIFKEFVKDNFLTQHARQRKNDGYCSERWDKASYFKLFARTFRHDRSKGKRAWDLEIGTPEVPI